MASLPIVCDDIMWEIWMAAEPLWNVQKLTQQNQFWILYNLFFNVLILQGPMEASIREEEAMLEAVPDQAI